MTYLCRRHDVVLNVVSRHTFRLQAVIRNNDLDLRVKFPDTLDEDVQFLIPQKGLGYYGHPWVDIWETKRILCFTQDNFFFCSTYIPHYIYVSISDATIIIVFCVCVCVGGGGGSYLFLGHTKQELMVSWLWLEIWPCDPQNWNKLKKEYILCHLRDCF